MKKELLQYTFPSSWTVSFNKLCIQTTFPELFVLNKSFDKKKLGSGRLEILLSGNPNGSYMNYVY